jgi:hypothetical protein
MPNLQLITGRYLIRFEPREMKHILALGDGREHENRFELVRRIAEINQAVYDQFVSPVVRAGSNELTANLMRMAHPSRVERYTFSDLNPYLWPLATMAEAARQQRKPVAEDNRFLEAERQASKLIEDGLDRYRDQRDHLTEETFKKMFESPWLSTLVGARRARRGPVSLQAQLERLNIKSAMRDFETGGAFDAFVRVMAYIHDNKAIDTRPFNLMRKIVAEHRVEPVTLAEYRETVQRQSLVLMLDEERALAGLIKLVPDLDMRHTIMNFAEEILTAAGPMDADVATRYAAIRKLFAVDEPLVLAHPAIAPKQLAAPVIDVAPIVATKPAAKTAAKPPGKPTAKAGATAEKAVVAMQAVKAPAKRASKVPATPAATPIVPAVAKAEVVVGKTEAEANKSAAASAVKPRVTGAITKAKAAAKPKTTS